MTRPIKRAEVVGESDGKGLEMVVVPLPSAVKAQVPEPPVAVFSMRKILVIWVSGP